MKRRNRLSVITYLFLSSAFLFASFGSACAFVPMQSRDSNDFGPVVRAYLGYLRNEQEVVDDRASRREISSTYYRRNSNRIRALRQMAVKIAKETQNDYLPELEAVTRDEFGLLFERPPRPQEMRVGEVLRGTFRFLGVVRSAEPFYLFARLDPYEQAELSGTEGGSGVKVGAGPSTRTGSTSASSTRSRRVDVP